MSVDLNGTDPRDHLGFNGAVEAMPSPDFKRLAYKIGHQAWVTALPMPGTTVSVDTLPRHQLTDVVGDWLHWTPDGSSVTWVQGPTLFSQQLEGQRIPTSDDSPPPESSDMLREESAKSQEIVFEKPYARPTGVTALTGATVLPNGWY